MLLRGEYSGLTSGMQLLRSEQPDAPSKSADDEALWAGAVGMGELYALADLLSGVQAIAGLRGLVTAVCEVLWKGLGTDLIISMGLVFAAELLWMSWRDRTVDRRLI